MFNIDFANDEIKIEENLEKLRQKMWYNNKYNACSLYKFFTHKNL